MFHQSKNARALSCLVQLQPQCQQGVLAPIETRKQSLYARNIFTSRALFSDVSEIECPPFADSISEGDIRWEKAVGDSVAVDEVVCEIETDKTSVPLPSPVAGVVEGPCNPATRRPGPGVLLLHRSNNSRLDLAPGHFIYCLSLPCISCSLLATPSLLSPLPFYPVFFYKFTCIPYCILPF